MTETHQIEYTTKRCYTCGSFWAIESSRLTGYSTCPRCAGKRVEEAEALALQQERSTRALRGIIKKLKVTK